MDKQDKKALIKELLIIKDCLDITSSIKVELSCLTDSGGSDIIDSLGIPEIVQDSCNEIINIDVERFKNALSEKINDQILDLI